MPSSNSKRPKESPPAKSSGGSANALENRHDPVSARTRGWILSIAFLLITVASFLPAMRAVYTWDDEAWLTENQLIREPDGLARIWTEPGVALNTDRSAVQYYPMVFTTFWFEYRIYGAFFGAENVLDPAPYHMVNILLQALSGLVLWRVLKRLELKAAWLAALIWAIHPVQVESVAWVAERKNVLASVFFFATFYAYLRFETDFSGKQKRNWRWFIGALAFFILAITSKATACVAPAIVLALLWWQKKLTWRTTWPTLPFFVLGLAFAALVAHVEHNAAGASGAEFNFSLLQRVMIAGMNFWFYLWKLVAPQELLMIYPRWNLAAYWQLIFAAGAVAAFVALFAARNKIGRGPFCALACFVIILSPAIGFINFYSMVFSFVADHYQHLAIAASIVLLVETAARKLWPRVPRKAGVAAAAAIVAALGGITFWNSSLYQSNTRMWGHVVECNPDSWQPHQQLGSWLMEEKPVDLVRAEQEFRRSIQLKDNGPARANLAQLLRKKSPAEAELHARRSLELEPRYRVMLMLADILTSQGKAQDAHLFVANAAIMEPQNPYVFFRLGMSCVAIGNREGAIASFREALRLEPHYLDVHFNLGKQLLEDKQYQDAEKEFQFVVQRTQSAEAWILLANTLHMLGREAEAVQAQEKGLSLQNSSRSEK